MMAPAAAPATAAASTTNAKEIPWVDAWVRWERNSKTEVDEDNDDVDDDYALPPSTEQYTFKYPNGNGDDINLDIKGFADDSEQIWNSTGLALWRSSRQLCQFLVSEECTILTDAKSVLELGSGLGRCGLLAHHLTNDNARTVLTDGDTDALKQLRLNIKANTKADDDNILCVQLLWGEDYAKQFLLQQTSSSEKFDIILGSDLIYVNSVIQPLFETVRVLLKNDDTEKGVFLMAHCSRREGNEVDLSTVLDVAHEQGFQEEVLIEDDDISVFAFTFRQEEKQKMNKARTLSSGPNMHTTCLGIILSICCVSGQSTGEESATTSTGAVHVSTSTLLLSAFPLLCIAYILRRFNLGVENRLLVGIVRAFVQLSILGLILHPIFLMGMDMPWLVGLYVLFMILIATKETLSKPKYTYQHQPIMTFVIILLTIIVVGTFAFFFIIQPIPRYNPQYVIPISGMLMGQVITGSSVTCNFLSTQILEGGRREIELYLSFGSGAWESISRLVRGAITLGVTPTVNSLNVIGLVTIPGMMTGQILGGSPVTEAAHYQILIIYLNATCTFCTIVGNILVLYRVAFDTTTHTLRTDRFIEVLDKKKGFSLTEKLRSCCDCITSFVCFCGFFKHTQNDSTIDDGLPAFNTPYGSSNSIATNRIQILTRQVTLPRSDNCVPFFHIQNLQFSVPKGHTKINRKSEAQSSSLLPSPLLDDKQHVLCNNLNAILRKGEIGVVKGPSGAGKSTLLRVLSGLTPFDNGDVSACGLSLAACSRSDASHNNNMIQWRTNIRYVTQYKVDLPGTPRDFIQTVTSLHSYLTRDDAPSKDEMTEKTISYLAKWGMEANGDNSYPNIYHAYLDKEWKALSGGESQRMLIALALSSQPRVLLLDEATSGLENKTEKLVEKSIVDYVTANDASVLWVTHSEDLSSRLLAED